MRLPEEMMESISKVRFEALAGYCRRPETIFFSEEAQWLHARNEDVLVVVIRDRTDDDFSAILLARDLKLRYRFIDMTEFFGSPGAALAAAAPRLEKALLDLDEQRAQGDEKVPPGRLLYTHCPSREATSGFCSPQLARRIFPSQRVNHTNDALVRRCGWELH